MNSKDRGNNETVEFRRAVERAARWIGEFCDHPERFPVLSQVSPGQTRDLFPAAPPESGRSLDDILDDFEEKIVPGVTHWNHPSFFAYFSITGSYPGILGEFLSAALNVNGMLWRTSPALTELEMLSLDYVRQLLGLGDNHFGQILDTASTSSLVAMTAARESLSPLEIRRRGMAGRSDLPPLTVYTSQEAHASIDKAAIVLGIGTDNVRRVAVDDRFRMDPDALATTIANDIDAGMRPLCVTATVGTTATTSVDPVPAIAKVCREFGVWLHVDAAYAWAAAILPEKQRIFEGCDLADSIVVNPHKWLFTPIDLSVLYCRHKETLRKTFSLVPEYLRSGDEQDQPNLMDYGFQLGRRFRALKLWMVLNYYGVDGLRERIRGHIALADGFAQWANGHADFEVMAPVEFSTVCFRFNPSAAGQSDEHLDGLNLRLLESVNASGEAFLSHANVKGRITLRCAIGNIRTTQSHIDALKTLLESKASDLRIE